MKRTQTNIVSGDVTPMMAIWDSVKAKNPQNNKCLTVPEFVEAFKKIAKQTKKR